MPLTHALKNTLTLILAGGQGERLMPLTRHRAKPAVPFGGMYRIIDFTLSNCIHSGPSQHLRADAVSRALPGGAHPLWMELPTATPESVHLRATAAPPPLG